ncbi:MAG: 50S ribosomal protein L20 [Candidatus Margulisbacteria bacterium]|nr:50S ribosomal protein L20 [Candidatus Margulisiibacteriota bacterium]
MVRVKRGFVARRRRKKLLRRAKGFRGALGTQFRRAKQAVYKAMRHATVDRKTKKRTMRSLWIIRINAALKEAGLRYSQFINLLKKQNILLDRKMLADLAVNHSDDFKKLLAKLTGK